MSGRGHAVFRNAIASVVSVGSACWGWVHHQCRLAWRVWCVRLVLVVMGGFVCSVRSRSLVCFLMSVAETAANALAVWGDVVIQLVHKRGGG